MVKRFGSGGMLLLVVLCVLCALPASASGAGAEGPSLLPPVGGFVPARAFGGFGVTSALPSADEPKNTFCAEPCDTQCSRSTAARS